MPSVVMLSVAAPMAGLSDLYSPSHSVQVQSWSAKTSLPVVSVSKNAAATSRVESSAQGSSCQLKFVHDTTYEVAYARHCSFLTLIKKRGNFS
jgi:hypothetical protein